MRINMACHKRLEYIESILYIIVFIISCNLHCTLGTVVILTLLRYTLCIQVFEFTPVLHDQTHLKYTGTYSNSTR